MKPRLANKLLLASGLPLLLLGIVLWSTVSNLIVHGQIAAFLEARQLEIRSDLGIPFGQIVHIGRVQLVEQWLTGGGKVEQEIVSQGHKHSLPMPDSLVQRTRFVLRAFALLVLSLVLVTITVIWIWARRAVVLPVETLARRVRALAARSDTLLDLPFLSEDLARRDELGTLAHAFAGLVDRLTGRSRELQETVQHLETALEEIEETRSQLLQAQQFSMLGEFAAGLAHELGNPLAAAIQQLYLLEGAAQEEVGDIREQISLSLLRIDGILRALQGLYRSGDVQIEPVALEPSIQTAATRARQATGCPAVQRRGDDNCVVRGNRFLVEQSLYNLVKNAMENAGSNGTATLTTLRQDSQVLIIVENSGSAARLDQEGLPVYNALKGGMGVGLRIVSRSASLMGGTLRYTNRDNRTISELSLPLASTTH